MKIKSESSRLPTPSYPTSTHRPADVFIPLSQFGTVSFDTHVATLPPNPANKVIELALAEYRELAGRLVYDDHGRRCILLNDQGMRFVEAIALHIQRLVLSLAAVLSILS
ncbi:Agmatine coumaroyltransferase-2 [Nymphaea thermarum]|nr:Agmatine coumaroyltransferase-2 [Nymphaea thermarum]